jgi:hypothetical protein
MLVVVVRVACRDGEGERALEGAAGEDGLQRGGCGVCGALGPAAGCVALTLDYTEVLLCDRQLKVEVSLN